MCSQLSPLFITVTFSCNFPFLNFASAMAILAFLFCLFGLLRKSECSYSTYTPCQEFPKVGIVDCRNKGFDNRAAMEAIWMHRSYPTILMEYNFVTCITWAGSEVILLDNPVNCKCHFPKHVITSCKQTTAEIMATTEIMMVGTTPRNKMPIYSTDQRKNKIEVHTILVETTPSDKKPIYTTDQRRNKIKVHTTRRPTTKLDTDLSTSNMPIFPTTTEVPILPSYQPPDCIIWKHSETYIAMAGSFLIGIFITFCIACIRLRFFGKYSYNN